MSRHTAEGVDGKVRPWGYHIQGGSTDVLKHCSLQYCYVS